IVLPEILVRRFEDPTQPAKDELIFCDACTPIEQRWKQVAGWSPFSGLPLDRELVTSVLTRLGKELGGKPGRSMRVGPPSPVRELAGDEPHIPGGTLRGVLFGFGHYAKTNILPNLDSRIRITKVHEIDPTQLAPMRFSFQVDSHPEPRCGEEFDIFFLAGFHHTHAPLAVKALQQGAFAVVEKPIATSIQDLDELLDALRSHPGRLFPGFHRRYSELNEVALSDLGVT